MAKTGRWLALLILAAPLAMAQRAPGRYAGYAFFDRWGACYLAHGAHLDAVAERAKDALRAYAGQWVELEVESLAQPVNPGMARLERFRLVEASPPGEGAGALTLSPESPGSRRLALRLRNPRTEALPFEPDNLAVTVLARKPAGWSGQPNRQREPADGPSYALLSRYPVGGPGWVPYASGVHAGQKWGLRYEVALEGWEALEHLSALPAGGEHVLRLTLQLPAGEYEVVGSYADGQWHALSNAVPLRVGR